ncbi:hypothetical protein H0H92_005936, partial [Tricholoma furcatifolium]
MTSFDGVIRFARLDHTNYVEWSMRMEATLVRQGYWDLITEEAQTTDKKKMVEARALLILGVEDSQLPHMTNPNPKVIWETLGKVHRARGFGSRLSLRRSFITATKQPSQTMEAWIGS